jgi:cytochrome c-type biogenesis protein CcsB
MKFIKNIFLSVESMAAMLIIFAISIGAATFIENDYGVETSKSVVYNAKWFEVLLLLLAANLVYNVISYKLWRKGKRLSLLFHASFLFILLGAATTRYAGHEGMMHIREGNTSNSISSSEAFLSIKMSKSGLSSEKHKKLLMSNLGGNSFSESLDLNGDKVRIRYKNFIANAAEEIVESPNGAPLLQLMISEQGVQHDVVFWQNDGIRLSTFTLAFESDVDKTSPYLSIMRTDSGLVFQSNLNVTHTDKGDQSTTVLAAGGVHAFELFELYAIGPAMIVTRNYLDSGVIQAAEKEQIAGMESRTQPVNALIVEVEHGDNVQQATLFGGRGLGGDPKTVQFGDLSVQLSYGSMQFNIPFSIKLLDFQIDRYPGSNSPSSYASEVVLIDQEKGIQQPFRIYMNHILQHRGYRFFQSSYDQDELGTVLSVSLDPGTPITYVGYLLLAVGLLLNFLNRKSRFRILGQLIHNVRAEKAALLVVVALLAPAAQTAHSQTMPSAIGDIHKIDAAHAEKFGQLFVQDNQGRIKPMNTLGHEVLLKVARTSSIAGLSADQIILGMLMMPNAWQQVDMIRVKHPVLKSSLDISSDNKYASFSNFFDPSTGAYRFSQQVELADRKKPAMRDKLDKELIKVDERLNICYFVYVGNLLRIFPLQNDANNTWVSFETATRSTSGLEQEAVNHLMQSYRNAVQTALASGDWSTADEFLDSIKKYQTQVGSAVLPPPMKRKAEIFLNRASIFIRAGLTYFMVGLVLLVLGFLRIFWSKIKLNWLAVLLAVLLGLAFLFHTFGLAVRWYVSGHAPWSNGYESMIYIAWATLLAGLIFARRDPMPLAATSVLAGLTLMVAHLNWMDPQITNLVPVLRSYWLMIHVSMITASYGFLGLGAILAFLTLLLYVFKSKNNAARVELSIKELSMVNEQALIIGLVLLTIGNFLGAVWANESWGRYWGWDPKETWALVTILIYSAVIHFRLIPAMKSLWIFNVAALISFGSVIMTYFGVNFYLSGLHSYAQGDPVPVPTFVYYTVAIIFIVIAASFRSRKLVTTN